MPSHVLVQSIGAEAGPTLVVVAGVHGNEPAGVEALQMMGQRLEAAGGVARGEFIGLIGNPGALSRRQRYLDRDLNRLWLVPPLSVARTREGRERRRITRILGAARRRGRGALHVVDLHTTSGDGPPFFVVGGSPWGHETARSLPLPVVEGLARRLPGTMTEWLDRQGVSNLVLEAGSHRNPESVRHAEALLKVILARLGLVDPARLDADAALEHLAEQGRGLPRALSLSVRHPVHATDDFVMEPGFRNLDPVREGQLLARDRRGQIHASADGWLLLPLYQLQGADGFFLATPAPGAPATGKPPERSVVSKGIVSQ